VRKTWITRDGTEMEPRPIQGGDADLLMAFVKHLSFGTRYLRYGRGNFELREDEIQRVCHPDPERCVHLLVLMPTAADQAVVGSGRILFEAGAKSCELEMYGHRYLAKTWGRAPFARGAD